MKIVPLFCFLGLSLMQLAIGQEKQISLEEIYDGTFSTEGLEVLRSMDNGKQYSVLNFDRSDRISTIDLYDYETQEKVETLVNSADFKDIPFFTSYEFSNDESKVILATEIEPIFRHSRLGIYYVYDVESKELTRISDQKIQEPSLSPDGSSVAYVFENNMYILDLDTSETIQLTTDGKINSVINGVTDWVYEEEFAFV
ncbi:MAG: S9 family peptidase, partial [Flavobacteriaceae bacterium]|nr:S9 family peptidase [Flavobacteriaceae bacterium]